MIDDAKDRLTSRKFILTAIYMLGIFGLFFMDKVTVDMFAWLIEPVLISYLGLNVLQKFTGV